MNAEDLVRRQLAEAKPEPKRLLEIGAGAGSFLQQLTASSDISGLGIDPFATPRQAENFEIRQLAAEEIDSLKQWFDVVFSIHSLHHFSRPLQCLRALPSVVGWGGRCMLVDWHAGAQTGVSEHYYTLQQAADMIEKSGLRILTKARLGDIFSIEATLPFWKIAVAVNDDEKTICPKMFGMAPKLAVYTYSPADGFRLLEVRPNPYEKTMQHQKTFDVYDLVHDCQALLSAHIGKRGIARLQDMGVRLFFAKGSVKDNLAACGFAL